MGKAEISEQCAAGDKDACVRDFKAKEARQANLVQTAWYYFDKIKGNSKFTKLNELTSHPSCEWTHAAMTKNLADSLNEYLVGVCSTKEGDACRNSSARFLCEEKSAWWIQARDKLNIPAHCSIPLVNGDLCKEATLTIACSCAPKENSDWPITLS